MNLWNDGQTKDLFLTPSQPYWKETKVEEGTKITTHSRRRINEAAGGGGGGGGGRYNTNTVSICVPWQILIQYSVHTISETYRQHFKPQRCIFPSGT